MSVSGKADTQTDRRAELRFFWDEAKNNISVAVKLKKSASGDVAGIRSVVTGWRLCFP